MTVLIRLRLNVEQIFPQRASKVKIYEFSTGTLLHYIDFYRYYEIPQESNWWKQNLNAVKIHWNF